MSAWSWVARIGGYAAAPWTGGASIGIGEGIAQGLENNDAAKKANEQLQAGNDKAIGLYGQTFAPYLNAGAQASNTLAGMMGFTPSPAAQTTAPTGVDPRVDQAAGRLTEGLRDKWGAFVGDSPTPMATRGTLASLGQMPTQSSYAKVRMRAPDGEEADVDEREVGLFERAGAKRVNYGMV